MYLIGNTLYSLYANGYTKLYNFDIEKELVKVMKKIVSQSQPFIENTENIHLKSGYFNYFTRYNLLEHVKKPHRVLKEINRILKPNSILFITIANGYLINDILFRWGGWIMHRRSSHVQKFMKADMKKILRDAGLKIEESEEIKGFPFVDFHLMDKIPCSTVFKMFGQKKGQHMSVTYEFTASKVVEGET